MQAEHSKENINYDEILERFDLKLKQKIKNEIDMRVRDAMEKQKLDIKLRQQRLRELYQEESVAGASVSSNEAQCEDRKYEEMKKKILEIEANRERETKEFVHRKREQQKFLNCEEIRKILSKQQEVAIKKDQWWQIEEKMAASSRESHDDHFYHELIKKSVQEAMKEEFELSKKKWEKEIEVKRGYMQQINEKHKKEEEKARMRDEDKLLIQQQMELYTADQEKERREKKSRMKELDSEMKEMIEREKAFRQRRREEERSMCQQIELLASSAGGGGGGGKGGSAMSKEALKGELDNFNASLAELKAKRQAEEKRFDDKLAELVKEQDAKERYERKKLEAAWKELAKSVFKEREEQIKFKEAKKNIEKEMSATEKARIQEEMKNLSNWVTRDRHEEMCKKKRYAEDLRMQMEEQNRRKLEEKLAKEREKKAMVADRVKIEEEFNQLRLNPPKWNKHPLEGVKSATHYIPFPSTPTCQPSK